jgi:hypothetical protein
LRCPLLLTELYDLRSQSGTIMQTGLHMRSPVDTAAHNTGSENRAL